MDAAQQERLKRIGAISHEDMLDKHIGLKGTPQREDYEKQLAKELAKSNNKQNKVGSIHRVNPTNTE